MKGVVVKFNAERGFGFIRTEALKEDVFVHIKSVQGRKALSQGQSVTFDVTATDRGHAAVNVLPGAAQRSPSALFIGLASLIMLVVASVAALWVGLSWLWAYLIAINISTFILYVYDKSVAGGARLRVPEKVLHLLALLGGTPAAFASQQFLRHKTLKKSFRALFIGIVVLQIGFCMVYVMSRN